jgi:hypothetical protein
VAWKRFKKTVYIVIGKIGEGFGERIYYGEVFDLLQQKIYELKTAL